MTTQLQATAFWLDFYNIYPHERVYNWMDSVAEGKGDWYRNISLTSVAIAEYCRMGEFGFDQEAYDRGKEKVAELLEKHGLTDLMQW